MKDNDIFLTVSGIRESGKMFAVGDEYLGKGITTSKTQISDFARCSSYTLSHV